MPKRVFVFGQHRDAIPTGEERAGHECWIDGVRCWAGEVRLGGIVVYPL
jgi:hypothetical protein